jgi:hypothetical protein
MTPINMFHRKTSDKELKKEILNILHNYISKFQSVGDSTTTKKLLGLYTDLSQEFATPIVSPSNSGPPSNTSDTTSVKLEQSSSTNTQQSTSSV